MAKRRKTSSKRRWYIIGSVTVVLLGIAGVVGYTATPKTSADYQEDARIQLEKGDIRAAIIQLKNAVQADPDSAAARYELGAAYLRVGDATAAEKELKAARDRGFDANKVAVMLAPAYLYQGKFEALLNEIYANEAGSSTNDEILVWRGSAHLALRQYDAAQKAFSDALELNQKLPGAYVGLARLATERGDLKEAERQIDLAISFGPPSAEALGLKGELRRLNHDGEAALSFYDQALKLDPNNLTARMGRAVARIDLKQKDLAEQDVKAVLAVSPRHPVGNYLNALLHAQRGQQQEAINILQNLNDAISLHPPNLYLLAILQYRQRQYEQAEASVTRYLGLTKSGDERGSRLLATLLLRRGANERAVGLLKPLADANPDDAQVLSLLANAYLRNGQNVEAGKLLDKVITLSPDDAAARRSVAMSRLRLGQSDAAIKDLETATDLDPNSAQAPTLLALMHMRAGRLDEAEAVVKDMQAQMPDNPLGYSLAGAISVARRDLPKARSLFEKALSVQADYYPAQMNLAQLDVLEKKPEQAQARYDAVLKQNPDNLEARIASADLAARMQKVPEAIAQLEEAQRRNPQSLAPGLRLVELHLAQHDPQKALIVARTLPNLSSTPTALNALGRAQLAAGEANNAVATYRQVVGLAPNSSEAHYRLARASLAANNQSDAIASYQRAISINPDYTPAQAELIDLHVRNNRIDEALKVASNLRKARPDGAAADAFTGDILARTGKYAEAAEAYAKAFSQQPTSTIAIRWSAAAVKGGQSDRGTKVLSDWLAKNPDDGAARFALATLYLEQRDLENALAQHELLLAKNDDNPVVLNNLAWIYGERGDQRALEYAQRAHKLAPESPAIADTLGFLLVKQGQVDQGLKLLEQAHEKAPDSSEVSYHLAVALKSAGRTSEARQLLEAVMAANSQFQGAEEAKALLRELSGN